MFRFIRMIALGIILSLSVLPPAFAEGAFDEDVFREIEASLVCTDGCGMYLKACDNATAEQMRQDIRIKLTDGLTPEQIYGYMISVYGEEVMAAPPPSVPFNLTAWVTPFLVILIGGLVIYLSLDKWVFYRKTSAELSVDEVDMAQYEEEVEDEIKRYY